MISSNLYMFRLISRHIPVKTIRFYWLLDLLTKITSTAKIVLGNCKRLVVASLRLVLYSGVCHALAVNLSLMILVVNFYFELVHCVLMYWCPKKFIHLKHCTTQSLHFILCYLCQPLSHDFGCQPLLYCALIGCWTLQRWISSLYTHKQTQVVACWTAYLPI